MSAQEPDWVAALLDRRRFDWVPVGSGESGDFVYRRADGHAFAKLAPAARSAELAGERDRIAWLYGRGVACPEVLDWRAADEGACLVMTAMQGVPAVALSGGDLLATWPAITQQLSVLHALPARSCPFDRGLSRMFARAVDVVARGAVNADFLPEAERDMPAPALLARVEAELPARLLQEAADRVVCHGDPCLPNIMVDPASLRCTGLIDLGRLGTADRYADLALLLANAGEAWASSAQEAQACAILFETLGIGAPDRDRLAFYLRLDPLTWG